LGFKALATTSSGFAWSQGHPDYGITRAAALEHFRIMVEATDVPINADFQNGFAREPRGVEESVRLAVETGVAGLSIEDSTGDAARPLYDLDFAVSRVRAARRAIDQSGGDTLLVARAECFLVGEPDIAATVARLRAYADAGADCLYALGVRRISVGGALARSAWTGFMRAARGLAEEGRFDGFDEIVAGDSLNALMQEASRGRG
jgi:2-methylisocitrate lyase-like PEP mutase family enzyme